MTAASKIVSVLLLKAVLLGAPIEPGLEAPAGGYSMPGWGAVVGYGPQGQEQWRVDGDQVLLDADAGLLVAVGPGEDTLMSLFEPHELEYDVLEGRLRPQADPSWPAVKLQFPWPKEGGSYYLEEIEPDLFRRTELATKEGYSVSATFSGQDVLDVELELTRRSFTGGDYEDALDAWTERPMAVKSVVSTTVPLSAERPTLVVWRSPLNPTEGPSLRTSQTESSEPAQTTSGPAPEWAVGQWRIEIPGGPVPGADMTVGADGSARLSVPDNETPVPVRVGPSGRVSGRWGGIGNPGTATISGALKADGTGSGRIVVVMTDDNEQHTIDWTATKTGDDAPDDDQASGPVSGMIHLAQFEGESYGRSTQPKRRNENVRPKGLAVLLKLNRWVFEPASQEMRREFEPLAKALQQATDGATTLDLQDTQSPSPEHLRVVPITGTDETLTVAGEQYRPVVGLWLSDRGTFRNFYEGEERGRLQYVYVPPGPSVLTASLSEPGRMEVFVAGREGTFVEPAGNRDFQGAGHGSWSPDFKALPQGAPDLPFAELHDNYRPIGLGTSGVAGPTFRVWGPASGDDARISTDLTVNDEDAASSFGSNRGGSSGFGSNRSSGFGSNR